MLLDSAHITFKIKQSLDPLHELQKVRRICLEQPESEEILTADSTDLKPRSSAAPLDAAPIRIRLNFLDSRNRPSGKKLHHRIPIVGRDKGKLE
jgi:hypothetical protein